MGEIVRVAVIKVAYTLADGTPRRSWFDTPEAAAADIVAGQKLAIQYHPDYPHRIQRLADNPFALTAHNRYAGAAAMARAAADARKASAPERPKFKLAEKGEPMSWLEIFSRTLAWIIVGAMGLAILWTLRAIWRLARRLLGGGRAAASAPAAAPAIAPVAMRHASQPPATRTASPAAGRIAAVTRKPTIVPGSTVRRG